MLTPAEDTQPARAGDGALYASPPAAAQRSSSGDDTPAGKVLHYLQTAREHLPLGDAQRAESLRRARAGDEAEAEHLVRAYLELAALLALAFAPASVDPLDAIQEANVVLDQLVHDPDVSDPVRALPPAVLAAVTGAATR
ncbi:MAG: hypothetical protein M3276_04125 [Actinomycetota bacterium]|nr:hypothetical protein [Actinomycetota bacterium]